jgi:uncharacterized membrane protein
MPQVLTPLVPTLLLANGLAAGVMLSTVIGTVPLMMVLPYERYVQMVQFLWRRYDPFMPIANGIAFAADIVLAVTTPGPSRVLWSVAAALLACVMVISVRKNVPVNRYVMSLDPQSLPDDWGRRDQRAFWQRWNTIRTSLALTTLLVNVLAVALLAA